jgi:hypothetical protein
VLYKIDVVVLIAAARYLRGGGLSTDTNSEPYLIAKEIPSRPDEHERVLSDLAIVEHLYYKSALSQENRNRTSSALTTTLSLRSLRLRRSFRCIH